MSQQIYYKVEIAESGLNFELVDVSTLDQSVKHYDIVNSLYFTKILQKYESVSISNPDYIRYIVELIRNNSYSMIKDYNDYVRTLKAKGVRTVPSLEEYIVTYDTIRSEAVGYFARDLINEFDNIKQVVTGINNVANLVQKAVYNESGIPMDYETSNRLFELFAGGVNLVNIYLDRITDVINPLENDLSLMDLSEQIPPYRNAVLISLNDTVLSTEEVVENFLAYGPVIPEAESGSGIPIPSFNSLPVVTDLPNEVDGVYSVPDDASLDTYVPSLADIGDYVDPMPNPQVYTNQGTQTTNPVGVRD